MNDEEFIESVRKNREESVSFFSNARKPERERWVVCEFLNNLGLQLHEDEVTSSADEPPDVMYVDARFEVKEILDPERRRHAGYKESLRKAREAKTPSDLLEKYTPRDITYTEISDLVIKELVKLTKYDPATRSRLDLLFYVNLDDVHGYVSSQLVAPSELEPLGWCSVSFLAGPMSVVLYASQSAPAFIRAQQGVVRRSDA